MRLGDPQLKNIREVFVIKQIKVFDLDVEQGVSININGKIVKPKLAITPPWPKYNPDPRSCSGFGHAICMEEGRHSWFNHSMDYYHENGTANNVPPGFRGDL